MCRFSLQHCTLLNVSICAASVQSSAAGTGFHLLLYNSLAWERTEPVRVPLTGAHSWTVTGLNQLLATVPDDSQGSESVQMRI
jgi:hypothetical protein